MTCVIQPIATDDPVAWCVSLPVSVTQLRCAKTDEQIEIPFGVEIFGEPGHTVLDEIWIPVWQNGRGWRRTR